MWPSPAGEPGGSRIGRLVILDDITGAEELERKLVQRGQAIFHWPAGGRGGARGEYAAGRDWSTYAQMLAKQVAGRTNQKSKLLDTRLRGRLSVPREIVNSLLNFSRTSSTAFEDLDLNRLIRETLTLLEHQFQKAGSSWRRR